MDMKVIRGTKGGPGKNLVSHLAMGASRGAKASTKSAASRSEAIKGDVQLAASLIPPRESGE